MKIIYIRHGNKKYPNNFRGRQSDEKAHDSPLSVKGLDQMRELAMLLSRGSESINLQGSRPNLILVSPYIRTRQSCQMLTSFLPPSPPYASSLPPSSSSSEKNNISEKNTFDIIVDPLVSEYLGNQHFTEIDDCTKSYCPPTNEETMSQLESRVVTHCESLKHYQEAGVKCVWVISHGLFISKAVEYWVQEIFYPDEGEFFEIDI